jgi:hypothetical protein
MTTVLLSVDHESASYNAGESAIFRAALRQGLRVLRPLTIQMEVYQGDSIRNTYVFQDNGVYPDEAPADGIYSLAVPDPGSNGLLSGVVRAQKGSIRREERTVFSFIHPTAHIIGVTSEVLVDDDNDGLAEALAVNIDVEAQESSQYILNAYLHDKDGQTIAYAQINNAFNRTLGGDEITSQGIHTFRLLFPGSQIRSHGIDGPYFVRLILEDIAQGGATVDAPSESYQTAPYRASRFTP